jgi:hypothetical protein
MNRCLLRPRNIIWTKVAHGVLTRCRAGLAGPVRKPAQASKRYWPGQVGKPSIASTAIRNSVLFADAGGCILLYSFGRLSAAGFMTKPLSKSGSRHPKAPANSKGKPSMRGRDPAGGRSRGAGPDSAGEKMLARLADAIRRLVPPRLPDTSGASRGPAAQLPDPAPKAAKPGKRRK